jgi:hypothetical protein
VSGWNPNPMVRVEKPSVPEVVKSFRTEAEITAPLQRSSDSAPPEGYDTAGRGADGLVARNRTAYSLVSTCTAVKPAASSRAVRLDGSTGR